MRWRESAPVRKRPDLVLVVRGGGAAAGLASLANLHLARAVCRCPVPIVTGLGHANDRTLLDDLAWRAADTPSKAVGVVKSILRRLCTKACDDHRAIVETLGRMLTTTLMPLLASSRSALVEAAEKILGKESSRLREDAHVVERQAIAFRGTLALTQAELDRLASLLLAVAPQVPRSAGAQGQALYASILSTSRARLPEQARLAGDARGTAGMIGAVLDRQAYDLRAMLAALEAAARRRLGDEAARLSAASATARALDVRGTRPPRR